MKLSVKIEKIKGFLNPEEGEVLYKYALKSSELGPCLEIGSYCGKSTVYLGSACRETQSVLFAIDHHRGSEEHQIGEEYHDKELYDTENHLFDSFREFRKTLNQAKLEDTVIPVVAKSALVAKGWTTPLGMVFIDGGHSQEATLNDYRCWAVFIQRGGILAIHDIFPNPEEGGQAPYEIWKMALASGLFEKIELFETLGILRRV